MILRRRPFRVAPRWVPLAGILAGLLAGAIYWLGAQLWPANVAVALAMAATFWADSALLPAVTPALPATAPPGPVFWVFTLLIKYNALMALTAAAGPFPLPPHLTLGLIMIAGQAAAGGLAASQRATTLDLTIVLPTAFAPATLLGIPGLAGLVAAIVMRLLQSGSRTRGDVTLPLTEACFYLGAVATWRYV